MQGKMDRKLKGKLNFLSEVKTKFLMQLRGEFTSGRTFEGWQEGTITFLPTYKYFPNSDTYYDCIQGKKGKKKRAPAW
jgi:hypothetical protein